METPMPKLRVHNFSISLDACRARSRSMTRPG
jgi:hypothetical protein